MTFDSAGRVRNFKIIQGLLANKHSLDKHNGVTFFSNLKATLKKISKYKGSGKNKHNRIFGDFFFRVV